MFPSEGSRGEFVSSPLPASRGRPHPLAWGHFHLQGPRSYNSNFLCESYWLFCLPLPLLKSFMITLACSDNLEGSSHLKAIIISPGPPTSFDKEPHKFQGLGCGHFGGLILCSTSHLVSFFFFQLLCFQVLKPELSSFCIFSLLRWYIFPYIFPEWSWLPVGMFYGSCFKILVR